MKPYQPRTLPLAEINWEAHVPLIARANAALGRYDGMLQSIVNPTVLLSPLATQEAVLSSRIEGTQATLEEVLEFEALHPERIDPSKRDDIQEILNYRNAMKHAVESLEKRPLCLNGIKEIHRILLDSARGRSRAPGEFRRVQNFIGPPGGTIEQAIFVPPSADILGPALDNWEKYLHFDERDPLVQLAVAKAQFEIIHPFLDGNGRIGRILIPLFLYEQKALATPAFYLSHYLDTHRERYYQKLNAISSKDDWNGWITFFLTAVLEQANANLKKTKGILNLYQRLKIQLPSLIKSRYAIQAIDTIFNFPILTSDLFIKNSSIPRDSALRIIGQMKLSNLLHELIPGRGRRPTILIFKELLDITET